jgi:CRISPR-associated protein Csm3
MGPRTVERVPPDTMFTGKLLIRYNDEEELSNITRILDEGIRLLNNDFLGGSGSRGYGAVEVQFN